MSNSTPFFFRAWRPTVAVLSLIAIAYLLYVHRLGSLLPGYSLTEIVSYQGAASWHVIAHNPIDAPYKLLVWGLVGVSHHSLLATRVIAAVYGLLAVGLFFLIVRRWHGFRTAAFSAVLFATSAGLLHAARLGSAGILQTSVLVFIAVIVWRRQQRLQRSAAMIYLAVLIFALLWYVPGMIWFELFGFILLRRGLMRQLRANVPLHTALWVFLFLVVLTPLGIAVSQTPKLALTIFGLPSNLHALTHFGSNLLHNLMSIGIRSNGSAELWVGHTPLLNIIEVVLSLLGMYYYFYRERTARSVFLGIAALISLLLMSVGGAVTIISLLPILYLFMASGIDHLLREWLTVFPRNPVARSAGISLVCIMLFFSVLYQTRSYFVAWPHQAATRRIFNHPQP